MFPLDWEYPHQFNYEERGGWVIVQEYTESNCEGRLRPSLAIVSVHLLEAGAGLPAWLSNLSRSLLSTSVCFLRQGEHGAERR